MQGIAKRLFQEKFGKKITEISISKHTGRWKTIDEMVGLGIFSYIDYVIAERLLTPFPDASEEVAAFTAYLSLAARRGHLCISIQNGILRPSLNDLCEADEETFQTALSSLQLTGYESLIVNGTFSPPARLISETDSLEQCPIRRDGERYYFERYWCLEQTFLDHFLPILSASFQLTSQEKPHEEFVLDKSLLPEQAQAVASGCQRLFSIIVGGPGTGKTYTAGVLLRTLWEKMDANERQRCSIVLAAPTGKAASQLEGSISRAMGDVTGFPPIKGQTLHSLLGIGKRQNEGVERMIPATILLVDESSMIDAATFTRLFQSLKPGTRLIMLGDPFQLPPVEMGSFFTDLVASLMDSGCVTELKTCLRAELKSIIDAANAVKRGDIGGISYEKLDDGISPKEIQQKLLNYALPLYREAAKKVDDLDEAMKLFQQFRILSPLRQGPLGVDALNELFYEAIVGAHQLAPIMITVNNSRLDLFNGEVGLLVKDSINGDYAIFDKKIVPKALLPRYEYAFCISVHKSQGSEFDHVLMVLPTGAEGFGKEALYTGITRAKRKLVLWSAESTLQRILSKHSVRHSGLMNLSR